MRRFFSKRTAKAKLVLLIAATALLLVTFLYLLDWPTLTATGALRRLEREYLSPAGEVVARGDVHWPARTHDSGEGNHWMITQSPDGAYAVAVLERFWGVLWRSEGYPNYQRPTRYAQSSQTLSTVEVVLDSISSPEDRSGWFHAFLVFSRDDAITRVTVTEAALSTEEQYDPVSYIEARGTTADCVQVHPGIWLGELSFPCSDSGNNSAPWTILRGYNDAGDLIYAQLPDPR